MLSLNRTQRQVTATVILAITSIAPTVVIAYLVWHLSRPTHVREMEVELGDLLGSEVLIERVGHPRPNEDLLSGLTLRSFADDGSRQVTVFASSARLTREGGACAIQADELKVDTESMEVLATVLDRWAARALTRHKSFSLSAPRLQTKSATAGTASLSNLALIANQQPGTRRISASFWVSMAGGASRHEIASTRSLVDTNDWTMTLDTREGALPIAALPVDQKLAEWFGSEALLTGTLKLTRDAPSGWTIAYRGQVSNVDLSRLLTGHFPACEARGRATIDVTSALWGSLPRGRGDGWVKIDARLSGGPGAIGSNVLAALARDMRCRLGDQAVAARTALTHFGSLGIGIQLDADGGLRLEGTLDRPDGEKVMLTGVDQRPILHAPDGAASVRGLWRVLFPVSDDVLLPATDDTHVMRHLPLPGLQTSHPTVSGN